MQGRGLLMILILISFSFWAQAQNELVAPEPELGAPTPNTTELSPPAETIAPPALEAPNSAEPDPSSVLSPKPSQTKVDDFSEFEESGGSVPAPEKLAPQTPAEPPKISVLKVTPPSTPEPVAPAPPPPTAQAESKPKPKPISAKKKTVLQPPTASSSVPAQSMGGDEPDFSKEEQLHRTYEKYNAQPTSELSWEKARGDGKAQVYNVQSRDTLWDISQTLFGDSQFWPKVWAMNNETFPNPHEIMPDAKIQFFKGGLNEAPSLAISGAESPVVVAPPLAKNETDVGGTTNDAPAAVFPAPSRKSKMLKVLPDSLPIYRLGGVNKSNTKVEIINGRGQIAEPLVSLSHYVAEGELASVGEVIETEKGGATASEFQYIILQMSNDDGKIFHVARELETVKNPFIKSGNTGKMIEVQGEVEILEKVGDEKNYYRAIVRKAISPIVVGAQVLKGPLPLVDVIPGSPQVAVEATLIGGQYSAERKLYPLFSFVFIDSGSNAGLKEGETLNVFANLKSRNDKTVVQNRNRLVGRVKIIKTSENFSTVYVTQAFDELRLGDHVGGGATLSVSEKAENIPLEGVESGASDKKTEDAPDESLEL